MESAEDILSRIDSDIRDAYWKEKNLKRVIDLAKPAIVYAQKLADEHPKSRPQFLQSAKTMSYNVASFCWPGWDEPGIVITDAELKYGFTCAKLNLQLAFELERPADTLASADWLIGAYRLAQSDWQGALDAFSMADSAHPTPLYKGYILIARLAMGDAQANPEWDAHLDLLSSGKDSDFARKQLMTASAVFLKKTV